VENITDARKETKKEEHHLIWTMVMRPVAEHSVATNRKRKMPCLNICVSDVKDEFQ